MSAHNLNFSIDHAHERDGWINCRLTFDGVAYPIHASSVFPPFRPLLDFLRAIVVQRLPACFFWDEEGRGPFFEAWPAEKTTDVHLRIIYEGGDHTTIGEGESARIFGTAYRMLWIDASLPSEQVVNVFLDALRDFAVYNRQMDDWHLTVPDLLAFDHLRARDVPPRGSIPPSDPLGLVLSRYQDEEEKSGFQFLNLQMWNLVLASWRLDDTDAFWPQWIVLLEHALTGKPYELHFSNVHMERAFRRIAAKGILDPGEEIPDWSTRITAVPLEQPYFRLQVYKTDGRYTDFLKVDEVVDAYQLASAFISALDELLEGGYRPYPDEDGQVFDLRELPVGRLRELVRGKRPASGFTDA